MFVEHKEAGEVKELDAVSRRLLKAAAHIEKIGHWRGDTLTFGSCAVLAILDSHKEDGQRQWDEFGEAIGRLARALNMDPEHVDRTSFIYAWNDRNSKDEVVAKLRAVALGL